MTEIALRSTWGTLAAFALVVLVHAVVLYRTNKARMAKYDEMKVAMEQWTTVGDAYLADARLIKERTDEVIHLMREWRSVYAPTSRTLAAGEATTPKRSDFEHPPFSRSDYKERYRRDSWDEVFEQRANQKPYDQSQEEE